MCNKFSFISLLLLYSLSNSAQDKYKFQSDIDQKIKKDTVGTFNYDLDVNSYSFSGLYKMALKEFDKDPDLKKLTLSTTDSINYSKLKPVNAVDYIINRSQKEKIIIINEAHHKAPHRVFATSLLRGLYKNGYRYLGIETLADDTINILKHPTNFCGYYSSEPQFGNFIKEALDLGFVLFGYEADGMRGNERESGQAHNIANFMKHHPNSKYLIYCGYDHVLEGRTPHRRINMAERLKDSINIDPFTIDQVQYSEHYYPEYNEPLISFVNKKYPVILLNKDGSVFNGEKNTSYVDSKIVQPITNYINDRPDWMLMGKQRRFYRIPKSKITTYPALIFAYRAGESINQGVPADIIEVDNPNSNKKLILSKGKYEIIIKDKSYNIVNQYIESIK